MYSELKTLYHLALKPIRGADHAARLESFYAGQAERYDAFRERLLPARRDLFRQLPLPQGGVWVDLGGGTGANLEAVGHAIARLSKVYVVDLSPSMLAVARRRAQQAGWTHVECVEADATTFHPPTEGADVVSLSYSLTMIPDWIAAVENARAMLKPGGWLGVADFYVSRKYPGAGRVRHGSLTRWFWPAWFACDNVFLSPDHLPLLERWFHTECVSEKRARIPYLPGLRVPYYTFLGRKCPR
jgi:S-adenosylmethionine-diacylgycerolhomoserine-N-methlytransferase